MMEERECKVFREVKKCSTLTTEIKMNCLKNLERKNKIQKLKAKKILLISIIHIQRQHYNISFYI